MIHSIRSVTLRITLDVIMILLLLCFALGLWWTLAKPYATATQHNIFMTCPEIPKTSPVDFWIGYVGIILTFLSIVFVVVTLGVQIYEIMLQRKSIVDVSKSNSENYAIARNDYDSYVLKLVDRFLSADMGTCRQRNWLLRQAIIKDRTKTLTEISAIFAKQITDNWGTRKEYEELQKTEAFKDFSEFTKLIRFFDMMSRYQINEQPAMAIHFYYAWWRSYFIIMTDCFKSTFESIFPEQRQLSFMPDWYDLTTRMDAKMQQFGLPIE